LLTLVRLLYQDRLRRPVVWPVERGAEAVTWPALCRRRFRQEHGSDPPWLLVIGPTRACHLRCAGCYAASGPGNAHLPWA
jgi:hypothetical protein